MKKTNNWDWKDYLGVLYGSTLFVIGILSFLFLIYLVIASEVQNYVKFFGVMIIIFGGFEFSGIKN